MHEAVVVVQLYFFIYILVQQLLEKTVLGLFGMQEFHKNHAEISQKSFQFNQEAEGFWVRQVLTASRPQ